MNEIEIDINDENYVEIVLAIKALEIMYGPAINSEKRAIAVEKLSALFTPALNEFMGSIH